MDQELWPKITRETKFTRLPWGYKRDEEDPFTLVPVPELLDILEEAFAALDKGGTLREVSNWMLSKLPDHPLSHQALSQHWKKARKGDTQNARVKKLTEQKKKLKPKTDEEKELKKLQLERAAAKRAITRQTKKLEKIIDKEVTISGGEPEYQSTASYVAMDEVEAEKKVVFRPNPGPQTDFLVSSEQEVLYGGAAGGEPKSWFYRLLSE